MTQQNTTPATPSSHDAVAASHRRAAVGPDYGQRRVAVRGGQIMVGHWGPIKDRQAPTILAVHGVTSSHRSFGLLAEALPGVRIIAPDLRGRGRSNNLPGPFGMPAHADDLAAVLEELAEGPVVLVGHSMGAFATLVLADRHPERVAATVLIDGGIPLKVPEGLDADQTVQAILGPAAERLAMTFSGVEEYRGFWQHHPALQNEWTALLEDYITYDLEPAEPTDPAAGDAAKAPVAAGRFRPSTRYEAIAQDTVQQMADGSLLQAIQNLRTPTELVWSRRGLLNEIPGLYTQDYLEQWVDQVPALQQHLHITEVPETNHYTILMAAHGARSVASTVRHQLERLVTT